MADDWSFEESMSQLGCTVHAFDPSVDLPEAEAERLGDEKSIIFRQIGLGRHTGSDVIRVSNRGNARVSVPVMSLRDVLDKYLQPGTRVTYLKVDIEGTELKALPSAHRRIGFPSFVRDLFSSPASGSWLVKLK